MIAEFLQPITRTRAPTGPRDPVADGLHLLELDRRFRRRFPWLGAAELAAALGPRSTL